MILLVAACTSGGGGGTVPAPPAPVTGDTAAVDAPLFPRFDGEPPRNVLFLSLDTMRRDHMGRYGGTGLTPFLDQLAAEGFVLDDLSACSDWTVATTACVLSGASNLDRAEARGMVPILVGLPVKPIPRVGEPNGPTPMLPRWLSQAGYSALLVSANGFFSSAYGNAQGYQVLDHPGFWPALAIWDRAKELMDTTAPRGDPWFVHLHFFEPHRPYLPDDAYYEALPTLPPVPFDLSTEGGQNAAEAAVGAQPPVITGAETEAVKHHMRLLYQGEVRRFDRALAQLWQELEAEGMLDDTLVVFWTDHGEALWEHGVTEHGWFLHRNEADAIAFFWAKNIVPGAWAEPVEQIDLAPTVLALLGLERRPEVTGTPIGQGAPDRARFAMVDAIAGPVQSVRKGQHLMQFRWNRQGPGIDLFDLEVDPDEQHNLYDPDAPSDAALELWSLLAPKVAALEPWLDDPRQPVLVWPDGLPPHSD